MMWDFTLTLPDARTEYTPCIDIYTTPSIGGLRFMVRVRMK